MVPPAMSNDKPPQITPPENELKNEIQSLKNEVIQIKKILNSSSDKIIVLGQDNYELKSKITVHNENIERVIKRLETSDFLKEFIYPIILSIFAAIVFWLVFAFFPERIRHKKIRVKIGLNLYQIYTNMFSLFDIVMKVNTHSPSHFQKEIRSIKLNKNDFDLGLQNKCLNEHYLIYTDFPQELLPIGKSLYERVRKIDNTIDRLFSFSFYLQSNEILFLEKIRTKLSTHDLENHNKPAISVIGNRKLYPVNPSLSYMRNNIFELFQLFGELQQMVFKEKSLYSQSATVKLQYYFDRGDYNACISHAKKAIKKDTENKLLLKSYLFLAEYMNGNLNTCYKRLIEVIEEKPNLLHHRSFFKNILEDDRIQLILKENYPIEEIQKMNSVINQENKQKELFVKNAKTLQRYYIDKGKQADKSEGIDA